MEQVSVPKLIDTGPARGQLLSNSDYYWDKLLLVSEERDEFGGEGAPRVMGTCVHCPSGPGEERSYESHLLVPGHYHPWLTQGETEAHGDWVTCPRTSRSW